MTKGYNIVIIPSKEVSDTARVASKRMSEKYPTRFVLDETLHNPHITLYHIAFDTSVLETVKDKLRVIANSRNPFWLQEKQYRLVDTHWVDMSYIEDEPIMKLHLDVLEAVASYRVRDPGAEMTEEWSGMSALRQENLELYGWSEIRSLYRPHLTLTRLIEDETEESLRCLPDENFSFEVNTIALYELGEYGTCTSIVASYQLGEENI
jgi:2'-5' RNA ligase